MHHWGWLFPRSPFIMIGLTSMARVVWLVRLAGTETSLSPPLPSLAWPGLIFVLFSVLVTALVLRDCRALEGLLGPEEEESAVSWPPAPAWLPTPGRDSSSLGVLPSPPALLPPYFLPRLWWAPSPSPHLTSDLSIFRWRMSPSWAAQTLYSSGPDWRAATAPVCPPCPPPQASSRAPPARRVRPR